MVKIEINGVEMTLEEAREIYRGLDALFGHKAAPPPYVAPYVINPGPWVAPWYEELPKITC